MTKKILRNAIKCKHCAEIIESKSTHDFRRCSCGKVFVDGGFAYLRRGFPEQPAENHFEELAKYEEDEG
ncbi:DUF7695 domain-containing protein [Bacillus pumilus]|uniref:DUF7695 domain-containing protein n=1 Tax=Bacillus pumilus TaxID=1408 RepID=UPI0011A04612|nr:hypothetical protein [Bacillus pumilus]